MTKKRLLGITGNIFFCVIVCLFIFVSLCASFDFCCGFKESQAHMHRWIGFVLSLLAPALIVVGSIWSLRKKELRFAVWALALWIICIVYCCTVIIICLVADELSASLIVVAIPFLALCFFLLRSAWKRTAGDSALRSAFLRILILFAIGSITLGVALGIHFRIEWREMMKSIGGVFENFIGLLEVPNSNR